MNDQDNNLKSDIKAKKAFILELLKEGYEDPKVANAPADIVAFKNGEQYYFEIKYTMQEDKYFGAATLTEWEAALNMEDRYRFVVAMNKLEKWSFQIYTPEEFMNFSSIPPFKINFNVDVGVRKGAIKYSTSKRIWLTRERLRSMIALYEKFKNELK